MLINGKEFKPMQSFLVTTYQCPECSNCFTFDQALTHDCTKLPGKEVRNGRHIKKKNRKNTII